MKGEIVQRRGLMLLCYRQHNNMDWKRRQVLNSFKKIYIALVCYYTKAFINDPLDDLFP